MLASRYNWSLSTLKQKSSRKRRRKVPRIQQKKGLIELTRKHRSSAAKAKFSRDTAEWVVNNENGSDGAQPIAKVKVSTVKRVVFPVSVEGVSVASDTIWSRSFDLDLDLSVIQMMQMMTMARGRT